MGDFKIGSPTPQKRICIFKLVSFTHKDTTQYLMSNERKEHFDAIRIIFSLNQPSLIGICSEF